MTEKCPNCGSAMRTDSRKLADGRTEVHTWCTNSSTCRKSKTVKYISPEPTDEEWYGNPIAKALGL